MIAVGQEGYWQQHLRYTIDVTLNDRDHSLDGFLKLQYTNNSPDSIGFIWFHLWPNAFKNDRTAFSEQLLENGRTDFYFSSREERGYINRLDFRVSNSTLRTEDHPSYIDVVKVYLPKPLASGETTEITTPFHVRLSKNFSRGGHTEQSYQITQWYPKPAVYDRHGWHPMPYLDQGEFYSEFGSYDVRITLPDNYVVASTGELQNEAEKNWLKLRGDAKPFEKPVKKLAAPAAKKPVTNPTLIKSSPQTKTLRYLQGSVHDFAWFADKYFGVQHDTMQLPSGRIIDVYGFYSHKGAPVWKNSTRFIKDAVRFRSALIGEYPYNVISAVEAKMGFDGGMEYPTITSISPVTTEKSLDLLIEHEVGHNWFYGILGSNERNHPWMDEGLNSYYDERYERMKYGTSSTFNKSFNDKLPTSFEALFLATLIKTKQDQPISTSSENFTEVNYQLSSYYKTAAWLNSIERYIGRDLFDAHIRWYYEKWKFKHPQPEDFREIFTSNSTQDYSAYFSGLDKKGTITSQPARKRTIRPAFLFNFKDTYKYRYINFLPAIGTNKYDGLMLGAVIHNYTLPPENFQFIVAPLFATGSKQFNTIGRAGYSWYPDTRLQKIEVAASFAKFSSLSGSDSNGNKITGGFNKLAPSIRIHFKNKLARSNRERWIEWKTFLIGERGFEYSMKSTDSLFYPSKASTEFRYINQLTYNFADHRVLYPYDVQLQLQQGQDFYRATVTGHYFLNYADGGGASARVFAAKFGYLGGKTTQKEFETYIYQPKLTAVRGNEDYTYSNYFAGRNETAGFASQQIMMRDGGLKIRTDLFQGLQGRSDNWIAAINLSTSIPSSILPRVVPLRLFLDVGTYADAWDREATSARFLYVAGLQLSFIKGLVNIYAPLIYSSEFSDNLKTVPEENKFFRKISFSIDVHRFSLRRLSNNKIPL